MSSGGRRVIFVGPTAAGLPDPEWPRRLGFEVRPPVRRGDVRLLLPESPGVLVIVDGVFHHALAVGHVELRNAVNRRWNVWGLSSMGAIRAYEMRFMGVRGFGRVYDLFCRCGDFQDDEVALIHEQAPPHRPLTEPLVHLRLALSGLRDDGLLNAAVAAEVAEVLKGLYFGERTLSRLFAELGCRVEPGALSAIRARLEPFSKFRVKSLDLERFLMESPWEDSGRAGVSRCVEPPDSNIPWSDRR